MIQTSRLSVNGLMYSRFKYQIIYIVTIQRNMSTQTNDGKSVNKEINCEHQTL